MLHYTMKNDKKILIGSLIGGMIFFSLLVGFIGQGNIKAVKVGMLLDWVVSLKVSYSDLTITCNSHHR